MKEISTTSAFGLGRGSPRAWIPQRFAFALGSPSLDWLSLALILLLTVTWLSEGAASLAGVSSGAAGKLVDLGEAAVGLWLAIRLARERRLRLLAVLVVYAAWVTTGLINSHAPIGSDATDLRNWLLVPVMAGLLAFEGGGETRAGAVFVALCALTAFEFLLTVVQLFVVPFAAKSPDLIVGSFGVHQNAVFGLVTLLVACVGAAGYLVNARRGRLALALAVVLPLASSWVVVKLTTILLPVVILVTAATALVLSRTDRRRALTAVGAAVLSSALVIGSYAAFKPGSFAALNPGGGLSNYLAYGSTAGNVAGAQLGYAVVGNYWNAGVTTAALPAAAAPPGLRGFRISNLSAGAYTASVSGAGAPLPLVQAGRPYVFEVTAINGARVSQDAIPEIDWESRRGVAGVSTGTSVALNVGANRAVVLRVAGFAPPHALFARPKIAVFGKPPVGSSIYAWSPRLYPTAARTVAGPPQATIGGSVMGDYLNAGIETQLVPTPGGVPLDVFRITSLSPGDFTAMLAEQDRSPIRVAPGHVYRFTITAGGLGTAPARVQPQIEWRTGPRSARGSLRGMVTTTLGSPTSLRPALGGGVLLQLSGVAPARATYAVPRVVIAGALPAGSIVLAYTPAFRQTGRTAARLAGGPGSSSTAGTTTQQPAPGRGAPLPSTAARSPATGQPSPSSTTRETHAELGPLPGHLTLLRTVVRGLSGSITHELFGFGLGSARLPLYVNTADLTPQEAGTQSDAGTLLIERGWSGVAVVAVIAILLVILSVRLATGPGTGGWPSAFRLAVPGAITAMGAYALLGAMLQNHTAAITFWIILGLGLSFRAGAADGPDTS